MGRLHHCRARGSALSGFLPSGFQHRHASRQEIVYYLNMYSRKEPGDAQTRG
jgi:hypothetical protein